jgi:inner membrane transporter RhtA
MQTGTRPRPAAPAVVADGRATGRRGRAVGMALMLSSSLGSQTGAAIGALAFPVIGPVGVVAVRQWVAGVILLAVGRPRLRSFTRPQWLPVLGLAAVFATMNVSLYTAIDRVGLGLAVTLEFLGPLSVALVGAWTVTPPGLRRRITLACALLAGVGVVVLTRPQPTTDYFGVALGMLAALCWAGYILLNRTLGRRLPGVEGAAAAGALSALVYVPVGIVVLLAHPPTTAALVYALAAGVLSSVVPFLADLLALRRVPAHSFGIFMSLSPVFAATIGAAVLGEMLAAVDWLAIGLIVSANAVAVFVTSTTASRDAVVVPA